MRLLKSLLLVLLVIGFADVSALARTRIRTEVVVRKTVGYPGYDQDGHETVYYYTTTRYRDYFTDGSVRQYDKTVPGR